MKTMMIAASLALTLAATSPAAGQTPSAPARADMQCFAVMAYLGGQAEAGSPDMSGFAGGMMYFLGRLEGRSPGTDWLKELESYLQTLSDAEFTSHFERCGRELESMGAKLIAFGESVAGE